MKGIKILAIFVVAVMSVSLLARVEKPDKVPKAFEAIWDALVDLQGQTDDEIADRIADVDAEEAARIADVDAEETARIAADGVLQAQIDAMPVLPGGVIVMWSGTIGDIPNGWALCDGSGGTPDLTDKFICGASDDEGLGDTGGSATHSHSYSDLPEHTHDATCGEAGQHTHAFTEHGVDPRKANYSGGAYNYFYAAESTRDTRPAGAHTHNLTIGDTGQTSCSTDQAGSLPPYYKLAFIMKLEPDE